MTPKTTDTRKNRRPLVEPRDVVTIRPSASLRQAVELMQQRSVGCLVVTDEAGALKGIISERDVINRGTGNGGGSLDSITVGQAMTADVVCCEVGTPLDKIQRIMTTRRIRHLPILRDGVLVGMASSRDVMARQIEQDRAMRMAAEQAATLSSSLQSLDLGDVVEMVTRHVPMIFGAKRCVLHLPGGGDMPVGPLIDRHQCLCAPQDLPGLAEAGKGEKAMVAPVAPSCAAAVEGRFRMVIPLTMRGCERGAGKLLGRLCICDLADETAGDLLEYKGTLVQNILEANLTSAVRHEDLMRRTSIDPLTGVGTRMPFERRLEEECSRAARHDCPFCLAMVDVDHFKSVNDNLGHAGGDKALTLVGACMGRNKRTCDVLARFGGDEFVLLLPETELEGGFVVLERIRKQIEGMLVAEGVAMTISAGVVDNRSCPGASANELLRRADMALYRAKEAGRNRTESWASLAKDPAAISEDEGQEIVELREKLADISSGVKEAFIQSIGGLVKALDARDPYTKQHSENTMRYAVSIAETLGLPDEEVAVIRRAAVIHDLGKIGVCDSVLLCPRKLTPNELRIMQQHPVIAGRILDQMHFLERELPIVRHHHERWDGQGYPDGLAGTAIPLGARILAVADSFDAITSTRVYRDAKSVPESLQILADNAGTQFDRTVVEAMLKWADSVHRRIGREDRPLLTSDLLEAQLEYVLGA